MSIQDKSRPTALTPKAPSAHAPTPKSRLPCEPPQTPASLPDPGSSPATPFGSQTQFRPTPIGSTKNWVRSFILPCPGLRSPRAEPTRARKPRTTSAGIHRGAVQRKPREPQIQPLASFSSRPGLPETGCGAYPSRAPRRREVLPPSCVFRRTVTRRPRPTIR
jgi:hypothetical protein